MAVRKRKKNRFGYGMHDVRIKVRSCPYMDAYDLVIYIRGSDGVYHVAEPMELKFKKMGDSSALHEPTLRVDSDVAGDLLDALLEEMGRKGIKTQEDSRVEGRLEAMSEHLNDMRQLVFERRIK